MPLNKIHRLVLLGTTGVGKTALTEHLIFGNHIVGLGGPKTLGDIYEAIIETEPSNEEAVQIYDTPGSLFSLDSLKEGLTYEQEHYISIGDGFMLIYDISNRSSFDLVRLLRHKIALRHKESPVVVIGNKYDLDGIRDVSLTTALDWAKTDGAHLYETSVLDRDSLREPFTFITWCMANPGRPLPAQFQTSFSHTPTRKSFTIPQTRRHHHRHHQLLQEEPLVTPTSVIKDDTPPPPRTSAETSNSPSSHSTQENHVNTQSPQLTIRSVSSAISEYSVDSRISSHIYPDDAHYPRGGLLGLADCMSNRSKERKLK